MSKDQDRKSPLVEAAEALEEELRKVASVTREAQRLPLNSRKNLERTGASLMQLGQVDERLAPLVQRLLATVSDLAARQQADAERLGERARELQRRRETYQGLVERWGTLGAGAQALNGELQALLRAREANGPQASDTEPLQRVHATMSSLIADAEAMSKAASAEDFDELARDADGLRQQLLSARNKLTLLSGRG